MKAIKVVAFDCDGVMFDTVKANTAYYNHILKRFGMPDMTPEQFVFANMHTAERVLTKLFDDQAKLKAALAYRRRMSYDPFIRFMEIEPYLKPLLEKLRPKYKTAIATNRTDTIGRVLSEHGLEGCFDCVVSAFDVDFPKPNPQPLIKILEYFKIAPNEAIYVGDTELDEMAAKGAEVPLVAYNNPSLDADYHIKSLKELEKILEVEE
ncbi:HAD family hydrolase [Thermodesulfobacteriota bacterium]